MCDQCRMSGARIHVRGHLAERWFWSVRAAANSRGRQPRLDRPGEVLRRGARALPMPGRVRDGSRRKHAARDPHVHGLLVQRLRRQRMLGRDRRALRERCVRRCGDRVAHGQIVSPARIRGRCKTSELQTSRMQTIDDDLRDFVDPSSAPLPPRNGRCCCVGGPDVGPRRMRLAGGRSPVSVRRRRALQGTLPDVRGLRRQLQGVPLSTRRLRRRRAQDRSGRRVLSNRGIRRSPLRRVRSRE